MKTLMILIASAGVLAAQNTAQTDKERDLERALNLEKRAIAVTHVVNGPVVKGAPYSAEAVTETVQILSDGNRIETKSATKLYRDSQGRERREEGEPINLVYINDPMERINYTLHTGDKTAEKRPGTNFVLNWTSESGVSLVQSSSMVHSGTTEMIIGQPAIRVAGRGGVVILDEQAGPPVESSLGKRMIEGVEAEGSKTTVTIPAGAIGNIRPIEIVDERWYSADLHATILSRHSDPRTGTTEYRLINIQRGEQPRSLFEVPADFTLPGPGTRGGGRGGARGGNFIIQR